MEIDTGKRWPLFLLLLYLAEFAVLGIAPYDRTVWWAENLTALIPVSILVLLYWRGVRFSNTAYTLLAVYFLLHTVGGYYTFERVPIEKITEFFGFKRNHYDRVCHFLVGTAAFAALEFFDRHRLIRSRLLAAILTVMSIFGLAAVFELVEWTYAEFANPDAGAAFLGSQGDIWDAQKDMLADGLGAIFSTALYALLRWRKREAAL
ncbi:MAG: DUF2238 domain-containing protein [Victivallaceae bacterium]|nr:DUF2238 domain-containing protein [Victivallaceae bacterium]